MPFARVRFMGNASLPLQWAAVQLAQPCQLLLAAGQFLLGPGPGRSVPEDPGAARPALNGKSCWPAEGPGSGELVGRSGEEGVQIVPVVFVGVDLLGVFPGPALHFLLKGEGPQGAGQSRRRLSRRRDHSGLPPGWPSGRRRWAGPFASLPNMFTALLSQCPPPVEGEPLLGQGPFRQGRRGGGAGGWPRRGRRLSWPGRCPGPGRPVRPRRSRPG